MNRKEKTLSDDFLKTFYRLVYMVKIHQVTNPLMMECIDDFKNVVRRMLMEDDEIIVRVSRGNIFLQSEKVIHRREIGHLMSNMIQYFESRDLQGLCFYPSIQEAPAEEIVAFSRMLNDSEQHKESLEWFNEQLETLGGAWVEIVCEQDTIVTEQAFDTEASDGENLRKAKAKESYFYALNSVKEVAEKITTQKKVGVRKALRVIQNMVDLVMEDESVLLGLSTIRDYDDYTFTHSVNVAILSMCLGRHIGISRMSVNRLGICGLFHDLGKLDVPVEIIRLPRKLNAREFEVIKKHTIYSVAQIIKLQAARDLKSKILLPPFEHHMKYDLSGYPQIPRKKSVSLFGRILTIADVYDAITSPRNYRALALTQNQALGYMQAHSGTDFDPVLIKAFINMLGVYPVGSFLELDTGELALVTEAGKKTDRARPVVMLLAPGGKNSYIKIGEADLDERDPESGAFLRNIVKSLDSSAYGIQPAEFLY